MKAHVIENQKVINTIEVQSLDFMSGLLDASNGGSIGDIWDGETFTTPTLVSDEIAAEIRKKRNAKLTLCDWTQVIDAPVDQAAWATYRQALRDIPEQEGFPETVVWPTQPE